MVSDAEAPPLGRDVEERHACSRPISVPRRVSVESLNNGFGDPGGRDPAAVVAGVSYGYLSRDMARDVSGLMIDDTATDLYAAQTAAFSAAVAAEPWTGASLRDGVRVSDLLTAARQFTLERAVTA